jgi:hypothetical protein
MGRSDEAASIFKAIPASAKADPDTAEKYIEVRIAMGIAEGHYGKATRIARNARAQTLALQTLGPNYRGGRVPTRAKPSRHT